MQVISKWGYQKGSQRVMFFQRFQVTLVELIFVEKN